MIWLDEARARAALTLTHATFRVTAQAAGAKPSALPDWTDPADDFADDTENAPRREHDPAARAAQVAAFIHAAGGEGGG